MANRMHCGARTITIQALDGLPHTVTYGNFADRKRIVYVKSLKYKNEGSSDILDAILVDSAEWAKTKAPSLDLLDSLEISLIEKAKNTTKKRAAAPRKKP